MQLSESGARRSDAADLQRVIDLLQITEPEFWRDYRLLRLLRRSGYKYREFEYSILRTRYGYNWYGYETRKFYNRSITLQQWNSIGHLQKYFTKTVVPGRAPWDPDRTEYHLDGQFPLYKLEFKAKKSYNTHIGHLYGDEIGEYTKLHDWCWGYETVSIRKRLGWDSGYWRDCFHRGIKTRWAAACKELVRMPIHSLSDDWGADEFEEYIDRKYHLHNKKKYGYT